MQNNQNIYYVYRHTFNNSYQYIGKGKNERAYKTSGRSKLYSNILNKYGTPNIEIIHNDLSEKQSFILEIEEINNCKQNNIKLINLTNGGEGVSGFKHSEESKNKMKINTSFRNPEVREKIRKSKIGKPSPRKGILLSEKTKLKISLSRKGKNCGEKHHNYGKLGKDSISFGKTINNTIYCFIHDIYGIEQSTIYDLCKKYNLSDSKIHLVAKGKRSHHKGWKLEGSIYTKKKKQTMTQEHKDNISKSKVGKISPKKDNNEYYFINVETKEKIYCTKDSFRGIFNGNMSNINNMINLKSKVLTYRGWVYEEKLYLLKKKI